MTTPWYHLSSIIGAQRQLIIDLSQNTDTNSLTIVNRMDASLNELATAVSDANKNIGPALTQQEEVKRILDREERRLQERKQALDTADENQKRLVDLTNNATQRTKAMNSIYLVVVIALLLFVGVKLVAGFIPEILADLLVILIISGTIILVVYMYYNIMRRNNMDFNQIDLGDPAFMNGSKTSNKSESKNLLDARLGGCVGQGCCAVGTTYNDKYSICVPTKTGTMGYFIENKDMRLLSTCTSGNVYSETELKCVTSQ
jgi:ABC-type multidrug transport system fused ATPase/permease subunit